VKKQTRFTSERAIHAEINNGLRKITALGAEAAMLETKGHEYVRTGNPELVDTGNDLIRQADSIRSNSIPRIQSKLNKLKEALSSFKTPLLLGMPGDEGVNL
jgi:hypothetical protein